MFHSQVQGGKMERVGLEFNVQLTLEKDLAVGQRSLPELKLVGCTNGPFLFSPPYPCTLNFTPSRLHKDFTSLLQWWHFLCVLLLSLPTLSFPLAYQYSLKSPILKKKITQSFPRELPLMLLLRHSGTA